MPRPIHEVRICRSGIVLALLTMSLSAPLSADEGELNQEEEHQEKQVVTAPEPHQTKQAIAENTGIQQPFDLLDTRVKPATTSRLAWQAGESFAGISVPTPVLIAHGINPGPVLCLTAAVHGDELNGIEMVRRILYELDPQILHGTVIGVPIVNLSGFRRSSRYLPDRRDLNRYFPGDPQGSAASRIAYDFFDSIITHCDMLVDLHTGSFSRTNLPQLRANLNLENVVKLTQGFGATAVLHTVGTEGTLRRAATDAGIAAVTLEAGEPSRFQPEEVAHGVKAIRSVLKKQGMLKSFTLWGEPQPLYYESTWFRADAGGIFFSRVGLGDTVNSGQILGTITDPITNNRSTIKAVHGGRILGMALNQVVHPGFALYRVGIRKSTEEVVESADAEAGESEPEGTTEDTTPEQQVNPKQESGQASHETDNQGE